MPIVTYESVAEAARTLEARGDRVSVRKVTAELGGGSPNDVGPLLAQYRGAKATVQKPVIPLDPRIQDLIVKQIEAVAADAARAADDRAALALDDLEVVSEAGRIAEAKVQDLVQELEEVRRKVTENGAVVAVLKEELSSVRAAKDDAEKKLAVAEALAKVAETTIEEKKAMVEELRGQVAMLKSENDDLKKGLAAERQQRLQDALDQQLGTKKTVGKNGGKIETAAPVGA